MINKVLIVSPVTLINNWKEEFDKWAPKLRTEIVRPSKKEYDMEWLSSFHKSHILITNYEQLRTNSTIFEKMNFDILILDEAHKIKNFSTGISEGVFKVKREKFWALTGTPIENKPQDLASLLLQASPSKMFYLKDEKDPLTLKSIGSKFVLRRTKQDVLKELPATMILRPFGLSTLAIKAHELAIDERLTDASIPLLAIVLVCIIPLFILNKVIRQ